MNTQQPNYITQKCDGCYETKPCTVEDEDYYYCDECRTQECSKCGCSNRGCPIGGCFWDTATEEQLDEIIEEGLRHPNWRPTNTFIATFIKTSKTRDDKIILALLLEDSINPTDEDSDSEDEE